MDSCSNVFQFLENKTIFVTGATGFLAKAFVEKILRIQPNIKKLYLLVRAPNVNSATKRLHDEVLTKDLFKIVRENMGANVDSFFYEKIAPVPGDTSCENLGVLDFALRDEIWRTTDIMVNCAATTNFDERYDIAFAVNTMGPLNVLNFAKKCPMIKMFLHVSTAYVCGEGKGLIMEKPFCMGEVLKGTSRLYINVEKQMVDEKMNELLSQDAKGTEIASAMKDFGLERARLYGWPNTYVFTKAMGEMFLGQFRNNLSLIILRPTMITSTYKEPFPGYIEGLRTLDSFVAIFGKGKTNSVLARAETIIDAIPVDMVVNSMIMAMLVHINQNAENLKIYQVGSSFRNPLTISNLSDFALSYFTKNPWMDTKGKPIKVTKPKILSSRVQFHNYIKWKYVFPLKVFGLANAVCFQFFLATYKSSHRKIELAMRLAELYEPYVLFKGIFDDTNMDSLRVLAARDSCADGSVLNLDPKCINWEDYFLNIHIPGLIKYVMK